MQIMVNGEMRTVSDGLTVSALLEHLGLQPEATVVERNGDILERGVFSATALANGDVIELVRFVGGG